MATSVDRDLAGQADTDPSSDESYDLIATATVGFVCVFAAVMAWRMLRGSASARMDLTVLATLALPLKIVLLVLGRTHLGVVHAVFELLGIVALLTFFASAFRPSGRSHFAR